MQSASKFCEFDLSKYYDQRGDKEQNYKGVCIYFVTDSVIFNGKYFEFNEGTKTIGIKEEDFEDLKSSEIIGFKLGFCNSEDECGKIIMKNGIINYNNLVDVEKSDLLNKSEEAFDEPKALNSAKDQDSFLSSKSFNIASVVLGCLFTAAAVVLSVFTAGIGTAVLGGFGAFIAGNTMYAAIVSALVGGIGIGMIGFGSKRVDDANVEENANKVKTVCENGSNESLKAANPLYRHRAKVVEAANPKLISDDEQTL